MGRFESNQGIMYIQKKNLASLSARTDQKLSILHVTDISSNRQQTIYRKKGFFQKTFKVPGEYTLLSKNSAPFFSFWHLTKYGRNKTQKCTMQTEHSDGAQRRAKYTKTQKSNNDTEQNKLLQDFSCYTNIQDLVGHLFNQSPL